MVLSGCHPAQQAPRGARDGASPPPRPRARLPGAIGPAPRSTPRCASRARARHAAPSRRLRAIPQESSVPQPVVPPTRGTEALAGRRGPGGRISIRCWVGVSLVPLRLLSTLVATAGLGVAIVAALKVGEAIWLGLFASHSQVADYHFGAESMIAHGGSAYSSLARYVSSGLLKGGALAIAGAGCFLVSMKLWRMPNKPAHLTGTTGARR